MAKGGNYERDVCKLLSLWWSNGHTDEVFWRTSNSGGRATSRKKAGKSTNTHVSDVGFTDVRGKPFLDMFAVEIKRGYNKKGWGASIADFIDIPIHHRSTLQYQEWLDQVFEAKKNSGAASWMIIHRRDEREAVVLISDAIFYYFNLHRKDKTLNYSLTHYQHRGNDAIIHIASLLLEDFLRLVIPQEVRTFVLKHKDGYVAQVGPWGTYGR